MSAVAAEYSAERSPTESPIRCRRALFHPAPDGTENSAADIMSPIPLSLEEEENAEVRALAAALAPAMFATDEALNARLPDIMSQPSHTSHQSYLDDYDGDGIDEEMRDLQISQEMLRQELALAQNFDNFLQYAAQSWDDEEDYDEECDGNRFLFSSPPPPIVSTEADVDTEGPMAAPEEERCSSPVESPVKSSDRFSTPSTEFTLVRTPETTDVTSSPRSSTSSAVIWMSSPQIADGLPYRLKDHMSSLKLLREEYGCWYSIDQTAHLMVNCPQEAGPVVVEYCLAASEATLKQLYVGIAETTSKKEPALPVRTLTIQIRPDVLCGAVMEAVSCAMMAKHAVVTKRQGGHLRAALHTYWMDFQLVTEKVQAKGFPRKLLVRVYHRDDDSGRGDESDDEGEMALLSPTSAPELVGPIITNLQPGLHLRECAALIQRMEIPFKTRRLAPLPNTPKPQQTMQQSVTEHLLEHYRACPSVRKGKITLPSLNADDFEIIQESWPLMEAVWEELETRDLTYSALHESSFGTFPSLPTLDVHYCSQLRRISRELMVMQLLKSAGQLEGYAREAEYNCAVIISLLKPAYAAYGVEPLDLPKPVPLTDYPLDYTPPQLLCPPWGPQVEHALNEIPSWNDERPGEDEDRSARSFRLARKAVQCVFEAFSKQDDEEQSARLGRKNAQIMDRLDRMRAHERELVLRLGQTNSEKAAKDAEVLLGKAHVREVPLLRWNIVTSSGPGTCSVTCRHIVFSTQLFPLIGGTTVTVFPLTEVDFTVREGTPSLLNPFATVVIVENHKGEELYSFRLSTGGKRLKVLLDRLKDKSFLREDVVV